MPKSFRVERQVLQSSTGDYTLVHMYIDAMSASDAGRCADDQKYRQDVAAVSVYTRATGLPAQYRNPEMP